MIETEWFDASIPTESRSDWSELDRFIDALDTMNGAIARIEEKIDRLVAVVVADEESKAAMREQFARYVGEAE